jgi:hypothetical protein
MEFITTFTEWIPSGLELALQDIVSINNFVGVPLLG